MERTPRCLGCGYDLSGLTKGPTGGAKLDVRCPECDRAFIAREYKRPRGKLWLLLWGNFAAVLAVFAVLPHDACGAPGLGYVGFAAWVVGAVTLAASWQFLEVHGYGRRGSAWMFLRHLVVVATALLFVSLAVATVKLGLKQP